MKFKIKKLLPLIGIAIFCYLLLKVGIMNIVDSLKGIKISYVLIAVIFVPLLVMMQALKWYVIIKKQKIKMTYAEAIRIQFISLFYGFVTPARLGTLIKVAYLQKKTKNFGKSTSSVVIERVFDLIVVLILAAFGSLILIRTITKEMFFNTAIWMFGLLLLVVLGFLFLISKNTGRKTFKFLYERLLPSNFKKKTRKDFNGFYNSMPKKRFLVWPFLLTIATWFVIYTPNFLIAKSLGVNIGYLTFIFLVSIATMIAQLPITISGLGVREAALVTMFGLFGIPAPKVMSFAILSSLIIIVSPSLIGFFFTLKESKLIKNKITKK